LRGDPRTAKLDPGGMPDEVLAHREERQACVAELAGRQWGNITVGQLHECGLSSAAIGRWAAGRRLHRVFQGVYAVGHQSPAPEARWAAALLACGEGAALSHHTAGALHGLIGSPDKIHITVARGVRARQGITVHSPSVPIQRGELTHAKGLRATTVSRTLIDLAAAGEPVERLVADAVARRLVSLQALRAYVARRAGARGAARLRRSIEGRQTRSGAEKLFVQWLKNRDIPIPSMNHRIGKLTVDGFWEDAGLVLEIDTIGTHGTAFSFENDRLRDAYLAARGLRTIRVTEHRWTNDGDRLERDIRRARAHR
jgi:very-short-patch-repair endonuclease